MRDSYERFLSKGYISKDQLFKFGLEETIYAPTEKANDVWKELKEKIKNNEPVFMRRFGQNSNGSHLYQELYRNILHNKNVKIDVNNNNEPAKIIKNMTGYSKEKKLQNQKTKDPKYKFIQNYQISHIFGRTKNIYAFTAPWNIAYIPKIIDPFTGHEAKGELVVEYQTMFQEKSFTYFKPLIDDYNQIITDKTFQTRIDEYFRKLRDKKAYPEDEITKLIDSIRVELTPISAPNY